MLYTRRGDAGTSGLFGTDVRLPKNSPVFDALGTLDELNSLLGLCKAHAQHESSDTAPIAEGLLSIQQCLFIAQAEIAGSARSVTRRHMTDLEDRIETLERRITTHTFVIPGLTEFSGLLDYARAVSRRAERSVIAIAGTRPVSAHTLAYLNRISSYLYAAARSAALSVPQKEPAPSYS